MLTFVKSYCCSFAVLTIILLNLPVIYGKQSREAAYSNDSGFFICMQKKTHEQFLKDLEQKSPYYRNGELEILENYIKGKIKILCWYKYGEVTMLPESLLRGKKPNIKSAVDQNAYFVAQAREIHGDTYDYELINYQRDDKEVTIICPIHGEFEQTPSSHLQNHGCRKCANVLASRCGIENGNSWGLTSWINKAKTSKEFDSFKLYIIRCWNENEEFFKIGRTYKKIKRRFNSKKSMPYNYESFKEITGSAREIFTLENKLKNKHKTYTYLPKKKFTGMYECFTQLNIT